MILWQALGQTKELSALFHPPFRRVPPLFWFSVLRALDYIFRKWQPTNQKSKSEPHLRNMLLTDLSFILNCIRAKRNADECRASSPHRINPHCMSASFLLQDPVSIMDPHRLFPLEGLNILLNLFVVLYLCSCVLDKNEMWCQRFCQKLWIPEVVSNMDVFVNAKWIFLIFCLGILINHAITSIGLAFDCSVLWPRIHY